LYLLSNPANAEHLRGCFKSSFLSWTPQPKANPGHLNEIFTGLRLSFRIFTQPPEMIEPSEG
jgi:hypothetical protein